MIRSSFCLFLVFLYCVAQNAPATDSTEWTDLHQTDFDQGTYRILTSGYYRLAENIEFNPRAPADPANAYGSYQLSAADWGTQYPEQTYQIGFWAAMTIEANNVTINLNGKTLQQHRSHNLMNRFFIVIELGSDYRWSANRTTCSGITIYNGRIGRTASHGIHGIDNAYVLIQDIQFRDFEGTGVTLQAVDTAQIVGCVASTSVDVRVNGLWDTALNLVPYIDNLVAASPSFQITVAGQQLAASSLQGELQALINYVYTRIITRGAGLDNPNEGSLEQSASWLFNNDFRRPDGDCWAFAITGRNGGVFPIGFSSTAIGNSKNINISHNDVQRVECATTESVAIATTAVNGRGQPVLDARGRVFSLLRKQGWQITNPKFTLRENNDPAKTWLNLQLDEVENLGSAKYVNGNTVANIQALIGKAILAGGVITDGLVTARSSFNNDLIAWIEADPATSASRLETYFNGNLLTQGERSFICNSGETYAVQYGVGAIRISSASTGSIDSTIMGSVRNWGNRGAGVCVYTVSTRSNPSPITTGYNGADARGIVIASSVDFYLINNYASDFASHWGSIYVFDVMTDCNYISWEGTEVFGVTGGEWVGDISYENNPTRFPVAVAFHVDSRSLNVTLNPYCVNQMSAPGGGFKLSSGNVTDLGEWEGCHQGKVPWWIWLLLAIVALIFIIALVAVIMACFEVKKEENSYSEMK